MFFFAYAMVPLYDVLCDITGFNGKTGTVETEKQYQVNEERLVSVSFFAATTPGFPVQFAPKVSSMEVIPGKFYTTRYIAKNTTDEIIYGQAIPSVAPTDAALHFKKLECFCFVKQAFQPRSDSGFGGSEIGKETRVSGENFGFPFFWRKFYANQDLGPVLLCKQQGL